MARQPPQEQREGRRTFRKALVELNGHRGRKQVAIAVAHALGISTEQNE
jgi:hypothetical protein